MMMKWLLLIPLALASPVAWDAADEAALAQLQDEYFATASDAGARIPLFTGVTPDDFSTDQPVSEEEAQQAAAVLEELADVVAALAAAPSQ
ncbi:hypothetical protein DIURU_001278 [Diutina rugosa]|uniref:Uncharacterized protein n=1 Tax=Diutina rugosa TaxID=5481 RepID=A0A642UUV5_DIURU|nr:uncharacterized protein DIURU_001278 [Diutina rugosa]KAA8905901.1 hypothetical protein DIURU_001278 [Diutina rugosa]